MSLRQNVCEKSSIFGGFGIWSSATTDISWGIVVDVKLAYETVMKQNLIAILRL